MSISMLPHLNACLNALSALFLALGFFFIRRGRREAHRSSMLAAVATSALFLTSYVVYHFNAGRTVFADPAWLRPYYLALLLTHTILAVVIVPLVIVTLVRALGERFDKHKRIARWTWPIWMYVSVTGVIVYVLLYHLNPPA
jgi:uncharacterized membrane protein YozB (DUF420 family)